MKIRNRYSRIINCPVSLINIYLKGKLLNDVDPCVGTPEECCSDCNQNNLCDATEAIECTFPGAPNYDPVATMDNGTYLFSCYGDLNGDGHIQLTDLLDLLQFFGLYCTEID